MAELKQFRIGDFLKRVKILVNIENDVVYKRVTIKTKSQGVFLRDIERGALIGTKKQFLLTEGQFVLSKIDARYGAFGIASNEVDGAIITGNFWAYEVNQNIVNIELFNLFTAGQNFIEICSKASSGTTHRKYLDEAKFLNFTIELPNIEQQNILIKKYKQKQALIEGIKEEITIQQRLLVNLRKAILQEAISGKLTAQWQKENSDAEPVLKLLEKIRSEKERLMKEKKIKKEKILSAVNDKDIGIELLKDACWCRLSDLFVIQKGLTGIQSAIPGKYPLVVTAEDRLSNNEYQIDGEAIVIPMVSSTGHGHASLNRIHYQTGKFAVGSILSALTPIDTKYINTYFYYTYLSIYKDDLIVKKMSGAANVSLSIQALSEIIVPFISKEAQDKVELILTNCDDLKSQINQSEIKLEVLMQAVLKEAFEEEPKTEPHAPKTFQRSVLAAYLIDNSQDDPFFGHVKLQKMLFMCEAVNNLDFDTDYKRHAMGPYDPKLIRSVDSQLKKAKWFEVKKLEGEISRYVYHPLEKVEEYKKYVGRYWDQQKIEHIFKLMKPMRTLQAEIVATLFSVNSDLKKTNISITDAILIDEARNNWHDNKKNIAVETWEKAIEWMKSKNLL